MDIKKLTQALHELNYKLQSGEYDRNDLFMLELTLSKLHQNLLSVLDGYDEIELSDPSGSCGHGNHAAAEYDNTGKPYCSLCCAPL